MLKALGEILLNRLPTVLELKVSLHPNSTIIFAVV